MERRNLGITELSDYIYCPAMWNFKWKENTPLLKVRAKDYWKDALVSTFLEYCKVWLSSGKHDLTILQALWKRNWVTDRLALDWTNTKPLEDTPHLTAQGWTILTQAQKYFSSNYAIPAAVDMSYYYDINNQRLTGSIDLLFYSNPEKTAVVAYKLTKSLYAASRMIGYNSPEITAWWAYLRKTISAYSPEPPVIRYYVLETTKEHIINTTRNERQLETLNQTITSIAQGIENNIVYPDYGWKCDSCNYRKICNKSNYVKEEN